MLEQKSCIWIVTLFLIRFTRDTHSHDRKIRQNDISFVQPRKHMAFSNSEQAPASRTNSGQVQTAIVL